VNYPELNEIVIATVKKILPYGAILMLDEYGGVEAFLHISEVSSGWTKSVGEHLKQGQKTVVKVVRLDKDNRQIDVSRKRVNEGERKRKMQEHKTATRAAKLLDRVAHQLKKKPEEAWKEAGDKLVEEYGDLYSAFEDLSKGGKPKSRIAKKWLDALTETAQKEIKPKKVEVKAALKISVFGSNGVEELKTVLKKLDSKKASIHYLGAPNYLVRVTAGDYKSAEKELATMKKVLEKTGSKVSWSLEKVK